MTMTESCLRFESDLAAACDPDEAISPLARRHFEHCLPCQVELARYRKLRRLMASLRGVTLTAADGEIDEVLAEFRPAAPVHRLDRHRHRPRRRAYVGGLAAAAATGAGAGALMLAARLARRGMLAS